MRSEGVFRIIRRPARRLRFNRLDNFKGVKPFPYPFHTLYGFLRRVPDANELISQIHKRLWPELSTPGL